MGEMARRQRASEGRRGRPAIRGTNMAKIRKGALSGKIGNIVYVDSKYGAVGRSRPRRAGYATSARLRPRSALNIVAKTWRTLTPKQFAAWAAAVKELKRRLPKGARCPQDGFHLFCKVNCVLVAAQERLTKDPPKFERIKRNPIGELEILNRGGAITMRVRVPSAPAEYTFVLGAPGCSAGRSFPPRRPAILGRLPQAVGGWSDLTELYRKAYGVPRVGEKVFIQTRQMIGGWEDDFKGTSAVVPQAE